MRLLLALTLCAVCMSAEAAHTEARLLLSAETARPGETVMAGVQLRMEKGWHTYWRNSGGSGFPTTIDWQLPAGVTAEPIQWPPPQKLPDKELTTYIYEKEVVLLVPLKLAADLRPGSLEIQANVSWLECQVECVKGDAKVKSTVKVADETKASADANLLATWQKKLPKPGESLAAHAWWQDNAKNDLRSLVIEWSATGSIRDPDFYPDSDEKFEVQPITQRIPSDKEKVRLLATVKKSAGDWPEAISGVLVQTSGTEPDAFDVKLRLLPGGPDNTARLDSSGAADQPVLAPALWKMLLYALIGGLILNVMPCVLPVIALKILGFVGQAKDDPRRVRGLGLIYALGVLVSFLVLAGLVIGVKAAGHKAGWGMQFGNPQFLIVLTVLVTLVALNLFGLFEVNLSGRVLGAAGTLSSKHGPAGAFFNGVLATILATPCTAPFLGAALGFAFGQSALVIILIFLTVGVGLALPYVLLSWNPAWLKFLPKPGAWMEKFKIAMGFPMLATAFWLFSLIPIHYGERSWWLGIFLVIIALASWVFGEFVQRGRSARGMGMVVALALLITGYVGVIEGQLRWRSPEMLDSPMIGKTGPKGIAWQAWSPEAVSKARAEGRPVLVDFTADWCLTCNAIIKPALESSSVRKSLEAIGAVALLGNYTRFPPDITDELHRFSRAGVPLVLIYPKNPEQPPTVLPEALTPGMVVSALEKAAR